MTNQPLKYGMIGGGIGSFIGDVHRKAASLDHQATLAAGAFSSTPERARESGGAFGLPDDRIYGSWSQMLERERARPEGERIDFVTVVTPNHLHYDAARACLEAGFHIVLDKPMVHTSAQAHELERTAEQSGLILAVTYNYTGYPMVREASRLVRSGALGPIRKVFVEYHQGWLATPVEKSGMKQAVWRTDPAKAGLGGALGDIGSHAENLCSYVTGLEIESLCADLTAFVPGRRLDDDAAVLLRFAGGAKGTLTVSQICAGEGNGLAISVYGEKGGLRWRQEDPDQLHSTHLDQPEQILTRGGPRLCEDAQCATRLPRGHPEGFLEAFANIYLGFIDAVRAQRAGREPEGLGRDFPGAREGARGVRFIERCVESARAGSAWVRF